MTASEIAAATPLQLLKKTFELLIENLDLLSKSLDEPIADEQGNISDKSSHDRVLYCQEIVQALMSGLDMSYDLASDMLALYIYMNKRLIECQVKVNRPSEKQKVQEAISDITSVAENIYAGVKMLPDIDLPEQSVYAGYGRNGEQQDYTTGLNSESDFKA